MSAGENSGAHSDYMSNIKYLGFVKDSASVPVYGYTADRSIEEQLKTEVPKVITRLKDLCLVKEERQRIKSEFGCWFCKRDDRGVYFIALCQPNYPERHVYAAIALIRTHLAQLGDYESEADVLLPSPRPLSGCTPRRRLWRLPPSTRT